MKFQRLNALSQSFKVYCNNNGKWEFVCVVASYDDLAPLAKNHGMIKTVCMMDHVESVFYADDFQ